MNRVAADSNIYVSALVFGGKPLQLLDLAIDGEIEIAVSDAIVEEMLRITLDKLKRTPEQLQEAEGYITAIAQRVTPTKRLMPCPPMPMTTACSNAPLP